MAYRIIDSCTACGTCMESCPSEAITEGEPYYIDLDACIECGVCVDSCPSESIVEE